MTDGYRGFAPGTVGAAGPYDFQPPHGTPSTNGMDRGTKIVLAMIFIPTLVGALLIGGLGLTFWLMDSGPDPEPPLAVADVLGKDSVVEAKEVVFDVTASAAHQGTESCAAGAADPQAAQVLRRTKCQARVEGALTTKDGLVKASTHVMRFPTEAAAQEAALGFKHAQMKFLQQGKPADGMIDLEGRYVVVTSVAAKPKHKQEGRTALVHLNAYINSLAIWIDK